MRIITTAVGDVSVLRAGATAVTPFTLPTSMFGVLNQRPSGVTYRRRWYFLGTWNRLGVITEDHTIAAAGVQPPASAAVATNSSSTPGPNTASLFYYLTYRAKLPNGVVVAESNPGPASNVLTGITNTSITVSSIPDTAPDPRVTHVGVWRSDGGAIAKLAVEVRLGVTSVLDRTSTVSLATREAMPNSDGSLSLERGLPPLGRFLEVYHDRLWISGDPRNPNRIYYSKLTEPEGFGAASYVSTLDGETVTGIKRVGDELVVFGRRVAYAIQGWSGADFRVRKITPSIGCISHHGIVNINERLWFPSEQGVYIYDGGFRYVMEDIRLDWRDRFIADPTTFATCQAEDDQEHHCYRLLVPYSTGSFIFVGNYEKLDPNVAGVPGGIQPRWSHDTRDRYDRVIGRLTESNSNRLILYVGSNDGFVRQENVMTNSDDDGDTAGKAVSLRTKHFSFDDPGGSDEEGKTLKRAWSYIKSEDTAWVFRPYGGDEETNTSTATGGWSDSVAASSSSGKVAKTRHPHPPPEKISGHGFTFRYTATGALNWAFRGLGGIYGPGPGFRGPSS